jgi:hypothetical protein
VRGVEGEEGWGRIGKDREGDIEGNGERKL